MANEKFIIPQKNISIIAELENGLIEEVGKINVPYASRSIFLKNRLIVSLCFGSKPKSRRLKIFDEFGNQLLKKSEYKFESINFKDNTVYLGGQYKSKESELFSFIDLTGVGLNINEIELPIKSIKGKSIDDILIRNNTLYLVDNIVFPKYIFKYDISIANNPKHIGTYELNCNGTYEHIIKGDINENWIMIFSSTVGRGGAFQHISIIGNEENWQEYNSLTFCVEKSFDHGLFGKDENDMDKVSYRVLDTCIIRDKLLILKRNGLFAINLSNKVTEKDLLQINNNETNYNKLIKINEENYIILNEEKYELLKL
jgi:hypothetical protein